MKKFYSPPIIAFILTVIFLYASIYCNLFSRKELSDIYGMKLQMPLFTGFLTISGFLLSLTAFIVVKMHEGVYLDEKYLEKIAPYLRIKADYNPTEPLKNLFVFLTITVATTLITSFSQFTIGNIDSLYIEIFCIALAVGSFVFVITSCFAVKKNIQEWIDKTRDKKIAEFSEKLKQNENQDDPDFNSQIK